MLKSTPVAGIALADYGPCWKEHRRFALMTLRNFGLGKDTMEQRILGEIQYTVETLDKSVGASCVDLHRVISQYLARRYRHRVSIFYYVDCRMLGIQNFFFNPLDGAKSSLSVVAGQYHKGEIFRVIKVKEIISIYYIAILSIS